MNSIKKELRIQGFKSKLILLGKPFLFLILGFVLVGPNPSFAKFDKLDLEKIIKFNPKTKKP